MIDKVITWVICQCGEKHRLIPGQSGLSIDTPVYWCGQELLKLKSGDNVEYEWENDEKMDR